MKEIYVLSGLGADERVFRLIDFSGYKINFIKWIPPLSNEPIENYAKRLLTQIKSPSPTLIGLSFGGMMAVEITKQIEVAKIILISSAKTKSEIPFYLRWVGFFRIHKIVPSRFFTRSNWLVEWFFGVQAAIGKKTLKEILKDADPVFSKWAVDKIVNWKNEYVPKNLTHIHGSADKLLPLVNCDFTIQHGGHLMILDKAEEISSLLRSLIN